MHSCRWWRCVSARQFLVEVPLEYGVVNFAPDFFTGRACLVADVAYYGLWFGGAGSLLDTDGEKTGAVVMQRLPDARSLDALRLMFKVFIT